MVRLCRLSYLIILVVGVILIVLSLLFTFTSPITVVAYLLLPIPALMIQAAMVKGDHTLMREAAAVSIGSLPRDNREHKTSSNAANQSYQVFRHHNMFNSYRCRLGSGCICYKGMTGEQGQFRWTSFSGPYCLWDSVLNASCLSTISR